VLFSNDQVAQFINAAFEPVWERVHPVPLVKIDFGNGKVVTRTLHGNIATYACTADGQVLDVLPGIYAAPTYLDQLKQFALLAKYADQSGKDKREAVLKEYHEKQADALKKNEAPLHLARTAGLSKRAIEDRIKLVIGVPPEEVPEHAAAPKVEKNPALEAAGDVADWKSLAADTKINETARRQMIHEMLTKNGLVRPEKVTKAIYKDVLHTDLDDPYLGLGEALFAEYPFAKEDKVR
jgi:hypothetical protein